MSLAAALVVADRKLSVTQLWGMSAWELHLKLQCRSKMGLGITLGIACFVWGTHFNWKFTNWNVSSPRSGMTVKKWLKPSSQGNIWRGLLSPRRGDTTEMVLRFWKGWSVEKWLYLIYVSKRVETRAEGLEPRWGMFSWILRRPWELLNFPR